MDKTDIVLIVIFIILLGVLITEFVFLLRKPKCPTIPDKKCPICPVCPPDKKCPICPTPKPCPEGDCKKRSEVNQSCSEIPCADGLVCFNQVCKVPISGICMKDLECYGDSKCINGVCGFKRTGGFGDVCSVDSDCGAGMLCDVASNICLRDIGARCTVKSDCANNFECIEGICGVPKPQPKSEYCYNSTDCLTYCGNPILESINTKTSTKTVLGKVVPFFVPFRAVATKNNILVIGVQGDSEIPVIKNNQNSSIFVNNRITNALYLLSGTKWIQINLDRFNITKPLIPVDISADSNTFYIVANQRLNTIDSFTTTLDYQYKNKRIADEYLYGKTDGYEYRSFMFSLKVGEFDLNVELVNPNKMLKMPMPQPMPMPEVCNTGKCNLKKSWRQVACDLNNMNNMKPMNMNALYNPYQPQNQSQMMSAPQPDNKDNNNNNNNGSINDFIDQQKSANNNKYIKLPESSWVISFDVKHSFVLMCASNGNLYLSNVNDLGNYKRIETDIPNIRFVRFTDKSIYVVSRQYYNTGKKVKQTIFDTIYIFNYDHIGKVNAINTSNCKIFDPFMKVCHNQYELQKLIIDQSGGMKNMYYDDNTPGMMNGGNRPTRYITQALRDAKNTLINSGNFSVIVNDITCTDITSSIVMTIWDEYNQMNHTFNIIVNPTSYDDYYQVEFDGRKLNQYSRQAIMMDNMITVQYQCV